MTGITPISAHDEDVAKDAYSRIRTKAVIGLEIQIEQLNEIGIDPETSVTDKLNIAGFLSKVSSAPEYSRSRAEGADGNAGRPTIIMNWIGQPPESLVAPDKPPELEPTGEIIEGEVVSE